jgi:hypothetical protein
MRFAVTPERFGPRPAPADVDATAIEGDRAQLGP